MIGVRIGLFTEGTYPIAPGGVTRWCELLIGSMPEHTFVPVSVIGHTERPVIAPAANVADTTLIPMWGPMRPALLRRGRRRLESVLADVWSAALPPTPDDEASDIEGMTRALRQLTAWRGSSLASLLAARGSTRALLAAWRAQREVRPELPRLTVIDAVQVAAHVDRVLALADVRVPRADVSHVAANGPSALLALRQWWSVGTPILLTEHGIYLRERYLAQARTSLSWPARRAVGAFLRTLSQVAYQEAIRIAPVSDFNQRWGVLLGADPAKIQTIHNGVETDRFRQILSEPSAPTISFVGRIDPLKDLGTLISAIPLVRAQVPDVQVRLFGPTPPANEDYHAGLVRLIADLGLTGVVRFEGAVSSAVPALEAGHVIALSSISEGLPYTVIEAMMVGRATVSTTVGGVAEVVGEDGACGLLVPPRDPEAMASALVDLLTDDERRRTMGARARERALATFSLALFTRRYRLAYQAVHDVAYAPPVLLGETPPLPVPVAELPRRAAVGRPHGSGPPRRVAGEGLRARGTAQQRPRRALAPTPAAGAWRYSEAAADAVLDTVTSGRSV